MTASSPSGALSAILGAVGRANVLVVAAVLALSPASAARLPSPLPGPSPRVR